jgi:hypothetical protein
MRSNAVGGGYCTLSLAWEGAVMMPLQRHTLFAEVMIIMCVALEHNSKQICP